MNYKPKICLILDNPLRDLDGLVLVAWHLARRGAEAWLLPMYEQGFDIRAIEPDFVLLNYVRPNNLSYALDYMRRGIHVGVLDTEGMGMMGKSPEEFATFIAKNGYAALVDMYCVWGKRQYDAFLKNEVIAEDRLKLIGCPRYDYCAPPWRDSLPIPDVEPGYVLLNTNFPSVNPRFSQGKKDEIHMIVKGGLTHEIAVNYTRDMQSAHVGMVDLIRALVARFPEQRFVLRPHPFESIATYEQAIKADNLMIRQEGTSIKWMNHARALIHSNCMTAVEAAAFGVPVLSPAWLDKPMLKVQLISDLSQHFENQEMLFERLSQELVKPIGKAAKTGSESGISTVLYCDGQSSQRMADSIFNALSMKRQRRTLPNPSWRFHAVDISRQMLGPSLYRQAETCLHAAAQSRKQSKLFSREQVASLVERIEHSAGVPGSVEVKEMLNNRLKRPRLASGHAICLSASQN